MNSFGNIFKITIYGESHGKGVGIVMDNVPAGLTLVASDFMPDMLRRQGGNQIGTTPRKEEDIPIFISGLFKDTTTGAPLNIFFENNNTRSSDYEAQRAIPRPGHADFVAGKKFGGFQDYRGGGHFSGRLTACLVAAGVVAKKILITKQINVNAKLIEIGGETDIEKGLQKAIEAKDSVGGIVQCIAQGVPIGLGEPFFQSLESQLAQIIFSIPAIKGIEFGSGFAAAKMFGSQHNDALENVEGKTNTNHAGGIVGGISNGNDLIFNVAIKPTSSTPQTQKSLNTQTNEIESFAIHGRHDLCIALRVPVVVEAATAIVLLDNMLVCQFVNRLL